MTVVGENVGAGRGGAKQRLPRRRLLLGAPGLLLARHAACSEAQYQLDQRFSIIQFSVKNLGLFSSQGSFRRFSATLAIDEARPDRTRIAVNVDANSLDMPWQEAANMLRSTEFFDVQRYPNVRFTSTSVVAAAPNDYRVSGVLELRGVRQPIVLDATLKNRSTDVADFVVKGSLRRSAFGMVAERLFIADDVNILILARIRITAASHAG